MDQRPSAALKAVATQLADLICQGKHTDGPAGALFAQLSADAPGIATGDCSEVAGNDHAGTGKDSVGIWTRQDKNGRRYYRRDPEKRPEWHLWADVHEIPPKSNRRRVILLGESVARGFLYDPYYNVAGELQAILSGIRELWDLEVIDLSRVSLLLNPLAELVGSCLKWQPDAVVIFAGNNWVYSLNELSYDQKELVHVFETEGIDGIKSFREGQMKKIIGDFFHLLQESLLKTGIPVIFVIPEFNLKDWKSHPAERILPRLSGERTVKWMEACKAAERAFKDAAMEDLGVAAGLMIEADGSNPYGYEMLADHYLSHRRFEKARECLETARDSILFNRSNNSMPRCIRIVRDSILLEAQRLKIGIVDLPVIFQTLFMDDIPDRTLFLDNCHLTIKGIKIAARYMARALTECLTDKAIPIGEIRESNIRPGDLVQAVAHFSAAIYNSHYGQSGEIIDYHCQKALSYTSLIKEPMMRYTDFSSRYVPSVFCRSFEELIAGGEMQQFEGGYALRHPKGRKLMDIKLTNAIAGALAPFEAGASERLEELRMQEHGIREPKDLLESFYSQDSYHEFFTGSNKAFLQVRAGQSHFHFIADGTHALNINMVCRTPNRHYRDKSILVCINEDPTALAQIPMSKQWLGSAFVVKKNLVRKGVNKLTIYWPDLTEPGAKVVHDPADSFLESIFPVLAEVYSLEVSIML